MFRCNKSQDYTMQFDYYFHKTSRNTSEIRGNTTFKETLDDSYSVNS